MNAQLPPTCTVCGETYWQFAPGEFVHLPAVCPNIGQVLDAVISDAGERKLYVADYRLFEEDIQRAEA
jgi:hypothetical protein